METNIGLAQDSPREVSHILSNIMADQYSVMDEDINAVAERIRTLGEKTPATLSEFIKSATLKEHPAKYSDAKTMFENLLADHETVIQNLRKDIESCLKLDDVETQGFLTQLMKKHEKIAWMLRAILEK